MKRLKRGFPRMAGLLLALFSLLSSLTGCFDLGEYGDGTQEEGDYSSYTDAFGDVVAIYGAGTTSYDVEASLFNSSTINQFEWDTESGGVEVVSHDYLYVAIPFEENMTLESMALYCQPDGEAGNGGIGEVCAFLLDSIAGIPEKIRKRGDPLFEEVEDPSAPGGVRQEEIPYDDPDRSSAIASDTFPIAGTGWVSFCFDKGWKLGPGTTKTIQVRSGNVLLLRFENNSGYREEDLSPVTFRFTNLLIRRAE